MTIIEKNNITLAVIVLVDTAVISTWLTTNGNLTALGLSLLLAAGLVKVLELISKGIANYAKNFNSGADSNVRQPTNPDAG